MLFSCKINETNSFLLDEINIHDDCCLSIEKNEELKKIHIQLSGYCTKVSLEEYAQYLDTLLKMNFEELKQIQTIYINFFDYNSKIRYELIQNVNKSKIWGNCLYLNNDNCFYLFNKETQYLINFENIIKKYYKGKSLEITFLGVEITTKDNVEKDSIINEEILMKDYYPISLGTMKIELK